MYILLITLLLWIQDCVVLVLLLEYNDLDISSPTVKIQAIKLEMGTT